MDYVLGLFGVLLVLEGLFMWLFPRQSMKILERLLILSKAYYRILGLAVLLLGLAVYWLAILR